MGNGWAHHAPSSNPACPCPPSSVPLRTAFHLLSAGAWAERFTLHVATGELRTATVLRRSDRAEYLFTVTASDRGTVPRSTSASIRVQVASTQLLLSLHHLPLAHPLEDTIQQPTAFFPTTFLPGHPLPLLIC